MHKGRMPGAVNELTKVTREVFSEAFIKLGGVPRLMEWAEEEGNLKFFYTLFAKVLPKEIKTEDLNRTHEQFIELMQMESEHKEITAGQPLELVETLPKIGQEKRNIT